VSDPRARQPKNESCSHHPKSYKNAVQRSGEVMLVYTTRMLWHLAMGFIKAPKVTTVRRSADLAMRCSPLDIDTYFHMNNAQYLRVSELARWRIFPATGIFGAVWKQKLMFLAVEQNITYLKPIAAFQKYVVSTTCDVYADDKWLYYEHIFLQHPDEVPKDKEPKVFAKVNLRAVMKLPDGKTVKVRTCAGIV